MWVNEVIVGSSALGMVPKQVTCETFVGEPAIDETEQRPEAGFHLLSLTVDIQSA
jgi:hypothetical protein